MRFLILFALLGQAEAKYLCSMQWNLIREGKSSKSFELQNAASVFPYKHTEVKLEANAAKSKVSIFQRYGVKDQNYVLYEWRCDEHLQCSGSRSERAEKAQTSEKIDLFPTTWAIGKIGEREIFRFRPHKKGFTYRFTQYDFPNGAPAGMELSCHE